MSTTTTKNDVNDISCSPGITIKPKSYEVDPHTDSGREWAHCVLHFYAGPDARVLLISSHGSMS